MTKLPNYVLLFHVTVFNGCLKSDTRALAAAFITVIGQMTEVSLVNVPILSKINCHQVPLINMENYKRTNCHMHTYIHWASADTYV